VNYVFIGEGRLARHLKFYLEDSGHNVLIWSRRSAIDLRDLVGPSDILGITVRDSEIETVAHGLRQVFPENRLIHFSGALWLEGVPGFHPLMTFSEGLYDPGTYPTIPFICEKESQQFAEIFPGLLNPTHLIRGKDKPLYHALVAASANLPQLIWKSAAQILEKELGFPFEKLEPLLRQSLQNSLRSPSTAPTGAISRQDFGLIEKHMAALSGTDLGQLYRVFAEAT